MGKIAVTTTPGNNSVLVDVSAGPVGQGNAALAPITEQVGVLQKTILALTNVPVSVISITTGNGVGGTKLYTLPKGRVNFLGAHAELTLSIASAQQADFTDGTPEGDVGIGTLAPANADALGTDGTDDDFATAAAFTMAAFAGSVDCASEPNGHKDGSSTAVPIFVNMLVDAADIDDGVTTTVLVSGTVTVYWFKIGDN